MSRELLEVPMELTDGQLDLVAAGANQNASLIEVDVVVRDNEIVKDVNVNANVLTGPTGNFNA